MLRRGQAGLSLVETLVSITIFALMTMGIVPLLGTAMRGGAATRTESVGRNVAAKTLERLRGLAFHTPYSATPRKVDLLDHFFPARTPAYAPPSTTTGFDAASNSFVTTCATSSTTPACSSVPLSAHVPAGYSVEIRLTFKNAATPTTTVPVPAAYSWNAASDSDKPPSDLLEVGVTSAWTVGARQRTFNVTSYVGNGMRPTLPSSGSAAPTAPPGGGGGSGSGGSTAPSSVKLRAEARIDYAVEGTATWKDASGRKTEVTMTSGNIHGYGEQLDSGSQADLKVRAGTTRAVRAADPAVSGDAGVEVVHTGAILDAHAPSDATSTVTTTNTDNQTLNTSEVNAPTGMAYVGPSEAGTVTTATRGVGPNVAGGLPFVKGYYDFNGVTNYFPANRPTHMWLNPQYVPTGTPGTPTSENPFNLRTTLGSNTYKMLSIVDALSPAGQDPRGEVEIDATSTTVPASRMVRARADIVQAGNIQLLPTANITTGVALLDFLNFKASVFCEARPDPAYASTAAGNWSTDLYWHADTSNNGTTALNRYVTSLPTQTYSGSSAGPVLNGDTNPLQTIKNLNGGNGPLIYDNSTNALDVYLFSGNGRRGVLKDWSMGSLQTSVASDERVVSAEYNGIIRLETNALRGPWLSPDSSTAYPDSDMTVSIGKLSCRSEDYR
jgi:Tfp pilus assembly protein PilV